MFGQDDANETTLGKKLRLRPYREPAPDALNFSRQREAAPYAPPPTRDPRYAQPQQPVQPVRPAQPRPSQQDESQLIPITEEEFLRWEANQQRSIY